MFKKAHIKNINADDIELSAKISEIYNRKIMQIKNTKILEFVEDKEVSELLEMRNYFAGKKQTILITINGL
jgi:hypothetical protein